MILGRGKNHNINHKIQMGSRIWEKVGGVAYWSPCFSRFGVEIVETILMQIQDTRVKRDYEDKSVWKLNKGRSSLKNTIIVLWS